MRTALISATLLLCALPALGLEPYLVKDINPVPEPAGSSPGDFVNLDGVALFAADDGISGKELWRSDGTAAGTWQVADLCPGECAGDPRYYALTDRLYFFTVTDNDDPDFGRRLWATDGTAAGTFQLTESSVRLAGRAAWVAGQGVLYFPATDPAHGMELWRTDGTPAGTYLVADLVPGSSGSNPNRLTPFKGSLYFTAADALRGGALWKSDGTRAGTVPVKDPAPSSAATAQPAVIGVVGGRLVFLAQPRPDRGFDLWSSDGTTKGTAPITAPGTLMILDSEIQGDRLYFIADDGRKGQELWVSNGTAKGTRPLTNLPRKEAFFSSQDNLVLFSISPALGNRFFFRVDDGAHGIETWVTDGTVKGTRLLRDLCPGACDGATYFWLSSLPGRVFLVGTNGTRGQELWVTDGTEAGTRLVRDICRGSCNSYPFAPFVVNGRMVFAAWDGVSGYELWTTDGTAANTARISDFAPETPWDGFEGVLAGGRLLFNAPGPEGRELWRTDGTAAGTRLVRDINQADLGGSNPASLMALDDEAFFFASDGGERALWKSDGTAAGTARVRAFDPQEADELLAEGPTEQVAGQLFFLLRREGRLIPWRSDGTEAGTYPLLGEGVGLCCNSPEIRAAGSTVFFPAADLDHGSELWASDGVSSGAPGTRLVRDLEPGTSGSSPQGLTAFQGKLYFSASTELLQRELWRSDGTEAGTVLVKDINPSGNSDPDFLTVHAGRLWFFADDSEHGVELWSSDGTGAGTALAVELAPGSDSFHPSRMVSLGNRLVIAGFSPREKGIWVSDGTPAGTRKISEVSMTVVPFYPDFAVFQGRLYFAVTIDFQRFLWVTDGTEAGTGPLLDRDGQAIRSPGRFAVIGDHLVFTTEDPGVPLWESDGTAAGTFRLLPAGVRHFGNLSDLVGAGPRAFFPAYSREEGVELWAVEEVHP